MKPSVVGFDDSNFSIQQLYKILVRENTKLIIRLNYLDRIISLFVQNQTQLNDQSKQGFIQCIITLINRINFMPFV